jgi:RHS repeat-associated protein
VTTRLRRVVYPSGQTSTYTYYPNSGDHRLQEIHHKKSGGTTLSKFSYTYDAVGNIKTWTQQQDANPAKAYDFEYDRGDQLRTGVWRTTEQTPTILKRYAYTYDSAGNRTVEQIDNAPVLSAYDSMNRLASQTPGGTMRFAGTLNEAATVTIQSQSAMVTSDNRFERGAQVSSGTNQVVVKAKDYAGNERTNTYEVSISGNTKTITFDANGSVTSDGTRTFEWDAENRLVAINQGSLRSEFTVNGQGHSVRRVEKDGSTTISDTRFIWSNGDMAEERQSSNGAVLKRFFALGIQDVNGNFFYGKDHLESVRELVAEDGSVRARYEYGPYGAQSKVSGDLNADFGYTGQYIHPFGLDFATHRAYDPSLGRWLSEDPIGLMGGPNLYAYVGGNPISTADPLGLGSWQPCGSRCMFRIEHDPHKGYHAQWKCWGSGASTGCIKPGGEGCEGSGPPPDNIKECLKKKKFFEKPQGPIRLETPECGPTCVNVLLFLAIVLYIVCGPQRQPA